MTRQAFVIDNKSTAQVDQASAVFHSEELFLAEQILILHFPIDVQSDDVRGGKEFAKADGAGVAARQHVCYVVKHDAHSHGFGEVRHLRAVFAVAYDSQSKAADFV